MPANPTNNTPSESLSAPVRDFVAFRERSVLHAVAKAFGNTSTEDEDKRKPFRVTVVDDLVMVEYTEETAALMRFWMKELGL
jgi:hypothetical protein